MNPFREALLAGQVALVTGGGTGIGLACAKALGACGARLAICHRQQDNVDAGLAALREAGVECDGAVCDIRESQETEAFVARLLDKFGRIDILVNNAGGQFMTPATALSSRGFQAVVRTNLTGTFNMTLAVATAAMIPAESGSIVNVIADIERGFPGMVHTGAARAGVENMTKTLAIEWIPHHVRVNAVAPGVIRTDAISQYGEGALEFRRQELPCKRLGSPEEVAGPVVFLASPAASYVTGITLPVDGGARLWGRTWPIPDPA